MNAGQPRILLIGTVDTKSEELAFMAESIAKAGGQTLLMDVGVLGAVGAVGIRVDISNHQVASSAQMSLEAVGKSEDENAAMAHMARGAAALAFELYRSKAIDGMLALGGTMGTDLALDVAAALPLGVPKCIASTIAFSPLVPPERIAPDLMMMLWSGGLYGLNSFCRSALAQAAGAVVGACMVAQRPAATKPIVGMTSLGSSALKYMVKLKPALEARGFELAVFHTTGMGGRAFEQLMPHFCCVMDFSLQEFVNELGGSVVTSGSSRLTAASRQGTPQLICPGATDMVDYPAWGKVPDQFVAQASHQHNRLIASAVIDSAMRVRVAQALSEKLLLAQAALHVFLPLAGIEEWDRTGAPLHDPTGLAAFYAAFAQSSFALQKPHQMSELNCHINDDAFTHAVLAKFDQWCAQGVIKTE